jgi:phosphatidylserine/phosphatidylglycerophosphate/cardiolipin synthase-like enzyme
MDESTQTILLDIPAEIWKCEILVNKNNPLPEAEALILESLFESGDFHKWAKSMGVSPPYRTLSSLISRELVQITGNGDLDFSEEIVEHMAAGTLIQFLNTRQGFHFSFWVVRELLTGTFHHRRILYEAPELKQGEVRIEAERLIEKREHENLHTLNVKDIVQPIRGTIAYEFNMKVQNVAAACRMIGVQSEDSEISIPFRWHKRQDGSIEALPTSNRELGKQILESRLISELQTKRTETETKRLWPTSPEVNALTKIDTLKKNVRRTEKGHAKASRALLNSLFDDAIESTEDAIAEIQENVLPRLNSVKSIVGTEFEQWNAIQAVIHSSTSKCVLLTAFTHPSFSDEAASRINDSLPDDCELLLLSGEPDRIHETGFSERTKEYEKHLRKNGVNSRVRVENTRRASHAKFVISDSGMLWIGSCNMLSAAPGSWVIETGLLIDDPVVSKSIIEHVLNDKWLNPQDEKFVEKIGQALPTDIRAKPRGTVINSLRKHLKNLKAVRDLDGREYHRGIALYCTSLMRELRTISDRPIWTLIETEQHRPLFLSMIRGARKRILIGTDAIRAGGLDKATISEISDRPSMAPHRASKFVVQICWGRQDPDYKKNDPEIIDAGKRIDILRKEVIKFDNKGSGLRAIFFPQDNRPMMNHGKFLAIDEQRLLITSDNLLSFADDEGMDSDARELGILIDSPWLASRHRAEIDLLNGQKYGDRYDRARWHGAMAGCLDELGGEATFHELMEQLMDRIQSSEQLMEDWFWTVNFICNQYGIDVQTAPYSILSEGAKDGFYVFKWVGDMKMKHQKWIPNISADDSRLDNLILVSPKNHILQESRIWTLDKENTNPESGVKNAKQAKKDDAFLLQLATALLENMMDSENWEDFGQVYARVIGGKPSLKIKKAGKLLESMQQWIEVSYTSDGHPLIRRRRE